MKPNYIEIRISQLKEELAKPNNEHDRAWYQRLIQELDWARQMESGTLTHNCFLERGTKHNS